MSRSHKEFTPRLNEHESEKETKLSITRRGKVVVGSVALAATAWIGGSIGHEVAENNPPEIVEIIPDHTAGIDPNGEIANLESTLEDHGYDASSITNLTDEGLENHDTIGPQSIVVYEQGSDTYAIDVVSDKK